MQKPQFPQQLQDKAPALGVRQGRGREPPSPPMSQHRAGSTATAEPAQRSRVGLKPRPSLKEIWLVLTFIFRLDTRTAEL